MAAPAAYPVIPGTDGVRKFRFGRPDDRKDKSGGYRIFYVYLREYRTILLLAIIAKSEQPDLTKAETTALAQVVQRIKGLLDSGRIR